VSRDVKYLTKNGSFVVYRLELAKHSAANDTHTVHVAERLTTLTLSEIMWIKNSIKHVNNILSNSHRSVS